MTDRIVETTTIGSSPGGPGGSPAPLKGEAITFSADPRTEYVAGGTQFWYASYWRSLPWSIDDVTIDYGADLYDRMLRDPQVAACLNIFKAGILEDGAHLMAAVTDEDKPDYADAQMLRDVCERMLEDVCPALDDVLWDLLDGIAFGNKVAELIWGDATLANGRQALQVKAIKVKPRTSVALVVDVYYNIVGVVARIPGVGLPVQNGTLLLGSVASQYNILPREKFCIFTFRPKDNDPRGTSILRPAYNAWWLKMQTWPEYLKFLVQFASPSLIGYTAPQSQSTYATAGQPAKTAEQIMVDTLVQMRNGTAAAFPSGAKVDPLSISESGAKGFLEAFKLYDHQITKAILHQTLATEEGEHQARAAASVHQDVLSTLIRQGKKAVERMIRNDILKPFIRYTFGEAMVALTPTVTLGNVEQQDFSSMATAIAALTTSQYLDPSQFPKLDQLLNLPPRAEQPTPRPGQPKQQDDPNAPPDDPNVPPDQEDTSEEDNAKPESTRPPAR